MQAAESLPAVLPRLAAALALTLAVSCASTPEPELAPMPEVVVEPLSDPAVEPLAIAPITAPEPATPAASAARSTWSDNGWRLGQMRPPGSRVEEGDGWAEQGVWAAVHGVEAGPLGNFDDGLVLVGPTDFVLVPELDADEGWGASIGYRWKYWQFMVQFQETDHDGSLPGTGVDHDTEITSLDLLLKRYYLVETPLQPYGILGIGWSEAEIENGTTTDLVAFQEAELLDGVNVTLGAGLAFYPLPWISVYGEAAYRFVEYYSSRGVDGRASSEVDGDMWMISVGASIWLLPGRN